MMQNQEKIELLKKAKGPIDNEFTQLEENIRHFICNI